MDKEAEAAPSAKRACSKSDNALRSKPNDEDFRDNIAVGFTPGLFFGRMGRQCRITPHVLITGLGCDSHLARYHAKDRRTSKVLTITSRLAGCTGIVTRDIVSVGSSRNGKVSKTSHRNSSPVRSRRWRMIGTYCATARRIRPPAEYAAWIAAAGYERSHPAAASPHERFRQRFSRRSTAKRSNVTRRSLTRCNASHSSHPRIIQFGS